MAGGLYRLDAFGLNNVWNRWRIERDALDEPETESRRKRRLLYADDFYDREAYDLARRMFPKIRVLPFRRSAR